jgi:proline iminopeptidase
MADNTSELIFGLAKRHYDDFVRVFQRYPAIKRVIIFGSRAKNTAKPESDFDLAVVAPNMSNQEFSRLWNELSDLPVLFKLDVLHWDKLKNTSLKNKILSEGQSFFMPDK